MQRIFILLLISFASVGSLLACTPGNLPFSEGFNNGTMPACWTTQPVSGNSVPFVTSTTMPNSSNVIVPEGSHFLYWQNYDYAGNGASVRLVSPAVSTLGLKNIKLNFKWLHRNFAASSQDAVIVQVSSNGTSWINLQTINRAIASDYSTNWANYEIALPASFENLSVVYVGFRFIAGGETYNMAMDDVRITAQSDCSQVDKAAPTNYCTPNIQVACFYGDYISNVNLLTLNHNPGGCTSDGEGYKNFSQTLTAPTLLQGKSYTLQLTTASSSSVLMAWIDYNANGIFESSEATNVNVNTSSNTASLTINVPANANIGNTRMRIINRRSGSLTATDACLDNTSGAYRGQVLDYTVKIICACLPPENVNASNLTFDGSTVNWNIPSAIPSHGFTVLNNTTNVTPANAAAGTDLNSSGNSYQWNALNNCDNQYAYVRSNCGVITPSEDCFAIGTCSAWEKVSFTLPKPACTPPATINISDIHANTANITWLNSGASSAFEYVVSTTNSTPVSNGTLVTSNNIAVSALLAATTYFVYVRSKCSPCNYSAWVSTSFTTPVGICLTNQTIFETFNTSPVNWTMELGSYSNIISYESTFTIGSVTVNPVNALSGNFLVFKAREQNNNTTVLKVPAFNTIGFSNIKINFDYFRSNSRPTFLDSMYIRYSKNNTDWYIVGQYSRVDNASVTEWVNKVIQLPSDASNSAAIFIQFVFVSKNGFAICVDNFRVSGEATTDVTLKINGATHFRPNECEEDFAIVEPYGINPVSDSVRAKYWEEAFLPTHNGSYYVSRHYEIYPTDLSFNKSAKITLFFTQEQFNAFNGQPQNVLHLPENATHTAGKINAMMVGYSGVSKNGDGLPSEYDSKPQPIFVELNDFIWNGAKNKWSVSFISQAFGGFVLTTNKGILPVTFVAFDVAQVKGSNTLKWQITHENELLYFDVEVSHDGIFFQKIASVQPLTINQDIYTFQHYLSNENSNKNYVYRIKAVQNDQRIVYSKIVSLNGQNSEAGIKLLPNPASTFITLYASVKMLQTPYTLYNSIGQVVFKGIINQLPFSLNVVSLKSGTYWLQLDQSKPLKFLKQ